MKDEFTQIHQNKKRESVVFLHKIIMKYSTEEIETRPICLIEGNDDKKYYSPRIRFISEKTPIFIDCSGKEGVINAERTLQFNKVLKNSKLLYFVDKDFDEYSISRNIYQTPCHSIENLYSSTEVLEYILQMDFNLTPSDECYNNALSIFENRQEEFHAQIIYLNAWLATCQKEPEKFQPTLRDILVKNLFSITMLNVKKLYEDSELKRILKVKICPPENDVLLKVLELEKKFTKGYHFRGKFELEFFIKIINMLIEDNNKGAGVFKGLKRKKVKLNFTDALHSLSGYAEHPQCLKDYVQKRLTNDSVELVVADH